MTTSGTTILGTTLFSLTPDFRAGESTISILQRVADAGCGPALEVIGHQAWRGFPHVSAEDERAFRSAVDALGFEPTSLGIYPHPFRRPGAPMGTDEQVADLTAQLEAAQRLGFPIVRTHLGMEPGLLRRVAAEADRVGVVLTFEVQGVATPDAPAVVDVLSLQQDMDGAYLGFTMDFSVTTRALPEVLDHAFRRHGLAEESIVEIHRIWALDLPIGQRIGMGLGVIAGHPQEHPLTVLVAGVLGRCGRTEPADWTDVFPVVHHAHAKIWDPDVEAIREPHGAWLAALDAAGYAGAIVSEWGGHEMLDSTEADALTVTRDHLTLLATLTEAGVTA
jgi:sugar phosphate isomerase/epimerase